MNSFNYDELNLELKFEHHSEIIFVGKSNVGKSTLINLLFKTDLARVSKTPVIISNFFLNAI